MKHNDYKIIEEKKCYAIFDDVEGKTQEIEISKDVANALKTEQRYENAVKRANERHTVSIDLFNYESDAFAYYDSYDFENDTAELSNEEKVHYVLERMKPKQANLLRILFFDGMTQEQIAKSEGVSQAAIAQRLMTAKIAFQKIFKNFS